MLSDKSFLHNWKELTSLLNTGGDRCMLAFAIVFEID